MSQLSTRPQSSRTSIERKTHTPELQGSVNATASATISAAVVQTHHGIQEAQNLSMGGMGVKSLGDEKPGSQTQPRSTTQKTIFNIRSKLLSAETFRKGSGWFRLLFQTDPSNLDYVLIACGVVCAIAAGVPFPLIGILFGQLVDDMNSAGCNNVASSLSLQHGVNQKVLQVVYVTVFSFFMIYIHSTCWSLVGERLVRRLREAYFSSLLRQNISYFDLLPPGEVSSRLAGDLEIIQTGTSEKVGIVLSSVSYFFAAYIVSFTKDTKLTGMLISLVPALFLMTMVGGRFLRKYTSSMSNHIAAATSIASESLSNMQLVHAFGAHDKLEAIFSAHLLQARTQGLKKAVTAAAQLGALYFIGYSANALAFWQGSRHISESVGQLGSRASVGSVYTVIFLLLDASFILSQVAPFLQIFGSAAGAAEKLLETINRTSEIDGTSTSEGDFLPAVRGDIALRNVSFAYSSRPDVQVLRSVSLTIPSNKHTALVGLSGSGKSTIAALILRLYDPTEGAVTLDGHDLRVLNVRQVRGSMGLVQQEPTLLDRSILENIAHGLVSSSAHEHLHPVLLGSTLYDLAQEVRSGSDFETTAGKHSPAVREICELVKNAAIVADAADFIERLDHGYATTVGSAGKQLSGGQKQRIAIARALVRRPKILILDEATAALDSVSERSIQHALDSAIIGRTTISVAHRLSTIKNAHNIVVMEGGNVAEQGTHSELLERDGPYANLVRLQTLSTASSTESTSRASTVVENIEEDKLRGDSFHKVASHSERAKADSSYREGSNDKERRGYEKPGLSIWAIISGIARFTRPHLVFVVIGLLGSAIVGGAYSGEAVIFGHTIGALSPCRSALAILSSGRLYGLLFFILALVEVCANVVNGSAFGWAAEKLLYRARILSLRTLLHQDIQWHESEGRTPSTLLSYISGDTNSMGALTGTILGILFAILVNLIAGVVLSHAVAWKIAVVLLACIPVLLGSGFMRLRVLAQFQERHQKAFAHSVAITVEAVSSIKTIATLSLERESLEVYRRSLKAPYDATLQAIFKGNFWLAFAYSTSNLVYALAYYWGFKQVASGLYSQTQFFIVLPALLFSAQACGQMFSLAPDLIKARVSAGNILHLLSLNPNDKLPRQYSSPPPPSAPSEKDLESAFDTPDDPSPSTSHGVNISFRDVHFSYPSRPDDPVLHGLSLDIRAGQFCALVGPSGAGKSTIIALLERFYHPSSGTITIDNRDINCINTADFRNNIALVPQDSVLFAGSVRFNIAVGARRGHEPTDEEIVEACKAANIHDTIMSLPDGYKTHVGSGGSRFSGGQRQRLAIARALVRKPRLLLLDEITSALDAESERLLQASLEKVMRNVTVLAIAHRLYTIRKADRIFCIEGGRCVGMGTHEELVARGGLYGENAGRQALDG